MDFPKDKFIADQNASEVTYKMARQKQELEDAYTLVWDNYVQVGLQENNHAGIRFTKYHLLPQTKVFVAEVQDEAKKTGNTSNKGRIVGTHGRPR